MEKREFRENAKNNRNRISEYDRKIKSSLIMSKLFSIKEYISADVVLTYASIESEADTYGIILSSLISLKDTAVPKIVGKGIMEFYYIKDLSDLKPGKYNIPEPDIKNIKNVKDINFENISVKNINALNNKFNINSFNKDNIAIIVPGLGFDKHLNRIGYGGGFYDRYIGKLRNDVILKNKKLGFDRYSVNVIGICYEEQVYEQIPKEDCDEAMDIIVTDKRIITA